MLFFRKCDKHIVSFIKNALNTKQQEHQLKKSDFSWLTFSMSVQCEHIWNNAVINTVREFPAMHRDVNKLCKSIL